MKKSLLTLLGVGLMLTSCQSDEPFAPVEGGEKQVTFTLNVPGELGTRAGATDNASDKGGWSNSQGNLSYTLVLRADNDVQTLIADAQGREVIFTPTVVLGRNYTVTAYAYFGDTAKSSIDAIAESKGINNETKDAYTWTGKINFATDEDGTNQNITLKRPYAKLRLIATDYNEAKTDVKSVTVEYKNQMYTMFDAVEGQFNTEKSVSFTNQWNKNYYEAATTDGSKTIFADYVPVNEIGVAPFTVTVEYQNGETYTRKFVEDIPVKRNALTTLKGAFFTAGAQITVNVVDAFDNDPINKSFVSTASQLQDAINSATPGETTEIILDGDIDLTQPIVFDASVNPTPAPTRSEEATACNYVLDLNGKAIVGRVPKSVGHVIEIRPGATLKVIGGEISSTAANGGSAIYNAGTLEVDGTTIEGASVRENEGYPSYPVNNYSNMTLKNVTITGYHGAIACSNAGTTTIENCVVNKENFSTSSHVFYIDNAGANVEVNGGTYTHKGGDGSLAYVNKGSITVNGGTFSTSTGGYGMAALTNGSITVNGGTFGAGFFDWGGKITLTGGEFAAKPDDKWISADKAFAQNVNGKWEVVDAVAKVGGKGYATIDEAIAAWTHNSTLTLLANVTLTDVVTLKSTEYHILDLGTYTMTAASKKDAIQITAEGRSSASYALDIKADATNPGGITATGKAVVKTTGKSGVKDRPIIRFYNGVFTATNIIYHSGSNGTNCPQFQFHGGVYNGTIYANRALIQFYGGTFNGSLQMSVDSSAYALISGGKFKSLNNLYGSALNADKFTIGSAKGVFDRGVYVDDEGYFVVGGPVITEFGDMFAAKATNASKAGSYLPYSSAAEHGLYYTDADMAIAKHGANNVVLK